MAIAPPKNRSIPATRWQPELLTKQREFLMSSGVLEQQAVLHMPVRQSRRAKLENSRPVQGKLLMSTLRIKLKALQITMQTQDLAKYMDFINSN